MTNVECRVKRRATLVGSLHQPAEDEQCAEAAQEEFEVHFEAEPVEFAEEGGLFHGYYFSIAGATARPTEKKSFSTG